MDVGDRRCLSLPEQHPIGPNAQLQRRGPAKRDRPQEPEYLRVAMVSQRHSREKVLQPLVPRPFKCQPIRPHHPTRAIADPALGVTQWIGRLAFEESDAL